MTEKFSREQIALLKKAALKLDASDALIQGSLQDTEQCYDLHNRIQNIIDDLAEILDDEGVDIWD